MGNSKYKHGFRFTLHRDALKLPLKWKRPRKIFVNSMSDLFHESMPEKFLRDVFEVMSKGDWHVYQVLTKRPKRMLSLTRFISFEPLLGPIGEIDLRGIAWAIAGGESGPNHRPVMAEWIREIREQCHEQSVSFFFKQWGGRTPKSGGRLLDGREWNEYPVQSHPFELPLVATL